MPYRGGSDGCSCLCCYCCCCVGNQRIPVSLHWTFFFVLVLQIVISLIQYKAQNWVYIMYIATLWGPILFVTGLLHEWGHVYRTKMSNGTCSYISIWPLGGFSDTCIENGTCLQEFWVAFFGPLMHIPQIVFWVIILAFVAPGGLDYYGAGLDVAALQNGGLDYFIAQLSKGSIDLNLMLFFLNLLVPAYPLDAARLLASMGVHCGLSVVKAAWMLCIVGGILGVVSLIAGIIGIIKSWQYGIFLLFMGIFMLWTTWSLFGSIKSNQIGTHPIFQPDCYHPDRIIRVTNLSHPSATAPAPNTIVRTTTTTTKRKPKPKKKKGKNDVEMGNRKPKDKSQKSSKKTPTNTGSSSNNSDKKPKASKEKKVPPSS